MNAPTRFLPACAVAALIAAAPATARAGSDEQHALALQGGWWNVEFGYRAPFGLFVDLGFPWFAMVLDGSIGGTDWNFAVGAKAGYELSLSDSWGLRFGVRDAQSVWHGCPCADGASTTGVKTLVSVEVGARYEADCGFVAGVDLSTYAVLVSKQGHADHYWPGYSLLFSQAYLGYRWLL